MPTNGLDAFSKRLRQLAEEAEALNGTHFVSLSEALTPSFLSEHSRFTSADEFWQPVVSGLTRLEDFTAIPEEKLDAVVQLETSFSSWREMLGAATLLWTKERPGLG